MIDRRSIKSLIQKDLWIIWSLVAAFWLTVAGFSATQTYFEFIEEKTPVAWSPIFLVRVCLWGLWIPFSLLIFDLGQRWPFERPYWLRRVVMHLSISVFLAYAHVLFYAFVIVRLRPFPWDAKYYEFSHVRAMEMSTTFKFDFLIYWGVLGAVLALSYYCQYREGELRAAELQGQLAQAQLQALKMQLQPHFLFNTLNAIAALVRKNENKAATDMLAGLSDLLRLTLENAGAQEVSLKQEIDFLERYLDIERLRFADRLHVRLQIAPETLEARVPNLILQPLVENAIRHGIAPRSTPGLIEIKAERENGRLCLQVKDNGPGMPPGQLTRSGVGLSNTRARLERLYGVNQSFVFNNAPEGGAVVALEIPFALARAAHELCENL
ncbi:MAG: sensor histidine kinase [bacterium]